KTQPQKPHRRPDEACHPPPGGGEGAPPGPKGGAAATPRQLLGGVGDRLGTGGVLMAPLFRGVLFFFAMSFVTSPMQLAVLRFL
ncbi:hypothetical protein CDT91_21905, partial [Cronobacter sakazakii]